MKPETQNSLTGTGGFDLKRLVRPNILALTPYRSARDDFKSGLLLDANENSFGSALGDQELNRYPDPRQEQLRSAVASFRNVKPEQVFLGVGSDEPIDLLIRIFCRPGTDRILITPPTYGMYKVSANINDVGVDEVPLNPDFSIDPDAFRSTSAVSRKILFLCSPNNPTANNLDRRHMTEIIASFDGIVVVDEAYIDFSTAQSMLTELDRFPNLVVLQTMSKSFGMAAIRLGMAFASPALIDIMNRVKAPYNVNNLTAAAAVDAINNREVMMRHIRDILSERTRLAESLAQINGIQKIFPSDANFLLVRMNNALDVYRRLAGMGIIVRYRGDQLHCDNCLRITVGTPDENNTLISALREVLN
ncbi:MAG: histidinol-phosphate transaminase [Balneolaceae bacterium]|nr:MAG: histidinol-phosphate transaminase [Balneolaceae bacterium]